MKDIFLFFLFFFLVTYCNGGVVYANWILENRHETNHIYKMGFILGP